MVNEQFSSEETIPVEETIFRRSRQEIQVGADGRNHIDVSFIGCFVVVFPALDTPWCCMVAEGLLVLAYIFNMIILQKAYLFKGYALREYDISYRSGVIWPKITTIPYMRVQQVCVEQSPVSKLFGLYSVEVVNGAQILNSLNVNGLTEERAAYIKNVITEKLRLNHD